MKDLHPEIKNPTPFSVAPLVVSDLQSKPCMLLVIKATFKFNLLGELGIAETQNPICLEGKQYGEPETSSYQLEPECSLLKKNVDVIVNGHAHPLDPNQPFMKTGFELATIRKVVEVVGKRTWVKNRFGIEPSQPEPIGNEIGLQHENAFGGTDDRMQNSDTTPSFLANPVGKGFVDSRIDWTSSIELPNLIYPGKDISTYGHTTLPASFGFVSPAWLPRRSYGGTYDEKWLATRSPRLPDDFDPRYFNAAPIDQQLAQSPLGGQPLWLFGLTAEPRLQLTMPPIDELNVAFTRRHSDVEKVKLQADTIIIDTDTQTIDVIFRHSTSIKRNALEFSSIEITPGVSLMKLVDSQHLKSA